MKRPWLFWSAVALALLIFAAMSIANVPVLTQRLISLAIGVSLALLGRRLSTRDRFGGKD